ncbi:G-protein coupled receptor dmsr-1-like isoform X2 [Panulirus ornatus]|uniref:G-protein coupled receptor dmsr-1-like isoform X2 n=1 Tax=Panulirus ornatus TaxID=150431 RepID=UPI003A8BDF9B
MKKSETIVFQNLNRGASSSSIQTPNMEQMKALTDAGVTGTLAIIATLANVTVDLSDTKDYNDADYLNYNVTANDTKANITVPDSEEYCSTAEWNHFRQSYQAVHGCMSLVVCLFGSVANVINMVVLTRRTMKSPTNAILTGLAVTDLLVMVEYIPYTMHQYVWRGRSLASQYSWGWAVFVLFHAHFAQVFHTISIWLTVTLAVWRYIAIAYPQNNATWCSMDRTHRVIVAAFICSLICNIPNYLNFTISDRKHEGQILYIVGFSHLALAHGGFLKSINFWIYAVMLKLLPCGALTGLSFALIQELLRAARRRAQLMKRNSSGRGGDAERQADRVTIMLLAILVLFLASEVPQGILGLLTVIPDSGFFPCYQKLGEIMDMLVLFNSAINFLLYCSMSQQFRDTFRELFKPCCVPVLAICTPGITAGWKAVPLAERRAETNNTGITHV